MYKARVEELRNRLIERHTADAGVIASDGYSRLAMKKYAPDLVEVGFAFVSGAVLLYSQQVGEKLDSEWLTHIRRLRRRRPVDAMVAVTVAETGTGNAFDSESIGQSLVRHARVLRWSAPAYLLNLKGCGGALSKHDEAIGLLWSNPLADRAYVTGSLAQLGVNLSDVGIARLSADPYDRVAAVCARHIDSLHAALTDLVLRVSSSRLWPTAVHGLLFAPIAQDGSTEDDQGGQRNSADPQGSTASHRALWRVIANHSRTVHGCRVGFSLSTTAAQAATVAAALWTMGTLISGISNQASMQDAAVTLNKLRSSRDPIQSLVALDSLDKQLDTLEVHRREGAPWFARFGLNHDAALLDALWPDYHAAASRVLVAPIQAKLEGRLNQLASLSDAEIASGGNVQVQAAYDTLKTYLMLAHPERADSAFLTKQMLATNAPARPQNATVTGGTWEDLRQHAITYYARHFKVGGSSAITPDVSLVASTRQTIIGVRGIQNSTDAIYRQIIDETRSKYPPVTLATLLGDHPSRGLFSTAATIPGVFTVHARRMG
ncbi:MAG: T6SS component TssM (IcmF/VasK) [uncultured Caballeronia sp.]|nr:MAG: T6SS component TssM (IcmF/VasK) [uncultured Caballeronia sp.]